MQKSANTNFLEALPKLTISNVRIHYPTLKDTLRAHAARLLRQHHHVAGNGVPLKYILDYGILHNDAEFIIFANQQVDALPIVLGAAGAPPYKVPFAERPYPQAQPPLAGLATAVEIQLHKEQLVFIQDFYEVLSMFEESLLNHVDEYLFEQLKINGSHVDVRLHTMISFLDRTYGTITQTDLQ